MEPDYEQITADRDEERGERWLQKMDARYGTVEQYRSPTPEQVAEAKARAEALDDLEQVMTLALEALADIPDAGGPAIDQFRADLLALGVTVVELDAHGIRYEDVGVAIGKRLVTATDLDAPGRNWLPGDPCGNCGSTRTVWHVDGPTMQAHCNSCGADDWDDD